MKREGQAVQQSWESYLSDEDRATLARGQWGRQVGGGSRPAVIAIDVQNYMVGERGASDSHYPLSCGETGWAAVDAAKQIIAAARSSKAPIFFSRLALDPSGNDGGVFTRKIGNLTGEYAFVDGTFGADFVAEVAPQPGDFVFVKKKLSAFFGTPLLAYLTDLHIDTVIIVGGSTSNCVRATVVDAAQYNLRVLVPEEAVFDRLPLSHAVSLFDMNRTYADVLKTEAVVQYLGGLSDVAAQRA